MTEFTSRPLNGAATHTTGGAACTETSSWFGNALALANRFVELQTDALLATRGSNERFLVGVLTLTILACLSFWLFRRVRLL